MAVWRDIDSDVRISGSLVLPNGSLTIGGNNVMTLINGKVDNTRSITVGAGLTGGGDFTADRTISVNFGTVAGTVAEGNHGHEMSAIAGLTDALAGKASTTHNHDTVYLGIGATAADSSKLNGQLASYYATSSALTTHTGDTSIHKNWGNWDTATNDLRINAKVLLSHNTTTNKVFINPNKSFAGVDIVGSATVDGNGIWHAGNLSKTDFITTTDPATVVSGFTVNGRMYAGTSTNAGSILVKDSAFQETIHIGGKVIFDETKVKTWISETGYARFKNTVRVSGLEIDTSSMITNLNAEYLSGYKADTFIRAISVRDIAGYGVSHGYAVTSQSPVSNSVNISAGLVITDTGKRYETTTTQQLALAGAPGSGYNRIDIIYIIGSKTKDTNGAYIPTGINEGAVAVYQGAAVNTGTPTAPYTQLYAEYPEAIPLAQVYRPGLVNDIDADKITDARKYAAVTSPKDATVEVRRKLNVSDEVTATKFNGSGAGLTSLPVNQFGTGRISSSNLPGSTMYTDVAQTITTNKTFSNAANLYFAGGTTYRIDSAGSAIFNGLTAGLSTIGNNSRIKGTANDITNYSYLAFYRSDNATRVGFIGKGDNASETITLYSDLGNTQIIAGNANLTVVRDTGVNILGTASISKDLEVLGELKTGGANEFPDPLLASGSISTWSSNKSTATTVSLDSTQAPSGTGANGSVKTEATGADAWAYNSTLYSATPGEWITFSAYVFSTASGKTGQLYINWLKADGSHSSVTAHSGTSFTAPTSWGRFSVTAQAPSDATQFRVRIDNDGGAGSIIYFSAFQVERGRAMTGFKPYSGGKNISIYHDGTDGGIKTDGSLNINTATFINNGNDLTLKAASNDAGDIIFRGADGTEYGRMWSNSAGTLIMSGGSTPTGSLQVQGNVVTINAATLKSNSNTVVDTAGKLYYQNGDTDSRYLKLAGGTVTGVVTFNSSPTINGGLLLKAGPTLDHVYMSFYADSQDQATRSGYFGYGSGGTTQMTISNEMADGNIMLMTNGNGRVAIGAVSPARMLDVRTDARIRTTLEVGTGTAANDLSVTSGGAFNWRNTLYSDTAGKVSINKTSNSEHPLHVKSNQSYMGMNLERTATTDVSGFSWQNADGNYTAHLAARDAGNGRTHISLYSGFGTLASLTENLALYDNGVMWVRSNIKTPQNLYVGGGSGLNHDPSIDLAIGDSDTGFNWVSDGKLQLYTNNTARLTVDTGTFNVHLPTLVDNHVSVAALSGRGFRFWNSDAYKISMDTNGGMTWVSGADYNMVFRMTSNNRGFAFQNDSQGGVNAHIEGNGRVNSKVGFRASNFEMAYNATEDSLDFVYHG